MSSLDNATDSTTALAEKADSTPADGRSGIGARTPDVDELLGVRPQADPCTDGLIHTATFQMSYRIVTAIARDDDPAEALGDLAVKLLSNPAALSCRDGQIVASWVWAVVRNSRVDRHRARIRERKHRAPYFHFKQAIRDHRDDPDDLMPYERAEALDLLSSLMRQSSCCLTDLQALVLKKIHVEGKSQTELAISLFKSKEKKFVIHRTYHRAVERFSAELERRIGQSSRRRFLNEALASPSLYPELAMCLNEVISQRSP
jgi:DNA-directed RNA polymerase specialized sigma24 family protein